MPGIAGVISQEAPGQCAILVKAMLKSMHHEPFYVSGTYNLPEIGIFCGWIAHPNSFSANQPFIDVEGNTVLIFAGECFPSSELRDLLKRRRGITRFTDGNWLLPLYAECGEAFFRKLNGLFSGLLIDRNRRKAFLFNDRFGLERIYWHEANNGFYFASEAKGLLRVLPQLRKFDTLGVTDFLRFGCTRGTRTLFHGISTLPPASLWSFEETKTVRRQYFSPQRWEEAQPINDSFAFSAELEETFKRILPRYFQSGAPIGISLTGGLDGRMIMSCLPDVVSRPICYTFAGEGTDLLDARIAKRIATTTGLEHRVLHIGHDFFSDFDSIADRTVYISDGCVGLLGTHEIYFNKLARALAPTRVTGVFGGEILRGVSFFKPLGFDRKLINPEWLEASGDREDNQHLHPVTFSISREIPQRRFGIIAAGRSQTIFRTPYLDNELVALAYRIPAALRPSPQPAVSIIRNNSAVLSRIPTDMGLLGRHHQEFLIQASRILRRAHFKLDYFYEEGLPKSLAMFNPVLSGLKRAGLLGCHKFLYYRSWFQNELAGFLNQRVQQITQKRSPLWNTDYLQKVVREHVTGESNRIHDINLILTLEAIERLLMGHFAGETQPSPENQLPAEIICR